jgi:hypothetical protein
MVLVSAQTRTTTRSTTIPFFHIATPSPKRLRERPDSELLSAARSGMARDQIGMGRLHGSIQRSTSVSIQSTEWDQLSVVADRRD